MAKHINLTILFTLLLVGIFSKDSLHLSTNLLSLFADKKSIKTLSIANNLGYSREMLVAVKGFDSKSKKKVRQLAKEFKKLKHIKYIYYSIVPTEKIQQYYKSHYGVLADFDNKKIDESWVKKRLKEVYDKQLSSVFYTNVNKSDPLSLFSLKSSDVLAKSHRGSYITLGDYGFLMRVVTDIDPSDMNYSKELYTDVNRIVLKYKDVVVFAPFFYTVENSQKIQDNVELIMVISTLFLLFVYFLLLKNMKLLFHTLVALASSMLFATLICALFVENFSVLSLAFGMSLTAVSIDYLLHYHFHNFYQSCKKVDKNVLFGYMTTVAAFVILAFLPIPLISQISIFALLSLSFAYVLFTFVFVYLDIKPYKELPKQQTQKSKNKIPASVLFVVSIVLIGYGGANFSFNGNIRDLDYQNKHLLKLEKLFKTNSSTKYSPVVVEAPTKEILLKRLHTIKKEYKDTFSLASFVLDTKTCMEKKQKLKEYDFEKLKRLINKEASKIGFRDGYFKDAYAFAKKDISCGIGDDDLFASYGLGIYKDKNRYYSTVFVKDTKLLKEYDFVTSLDVKEMFRKSAKTMYRDLVEFGLGVLVLIFALLFFSVKNRFVYALNYILFPFGVTLAVLTTFTTINIMHLFSLIIVVAIGIDYGIYMANSTKEQNTMTAIKYSLLSTFSAFGVLIFSSITALNSIGVVITLGCGAILILIKGMR